MSRIRRARERIRRSWKRGGPAEVGRDLGNYLGWRIAGSPDPTAASDLAWRLSRLEDTVGVLLFEEIIRSTMVDAGALVSVVLPTRNRKDLVQRAVASVKSQSYPNWELLVIDDSDDPLGDVDDDPRIRLLRSGGVGAGGARNLGLGEAVGEIVTFLDDDNEMARHWLKSVVHVMADSPDAKVVIGAQLVSPEPGSDDLPTIRYRRDFDWSTLTEYNYVDLGMLAHRRIPGLQFDEALPAFLDWDYLVRLTADFEPLMVPAMSGIYHTDAPSRISYQDRRPTLLMLRERFAEMVRPDRPGMSWISGDDRAAIEHMMGTVSSAASRPVHALVAAPGLEAVLDSIDPDTVTWTTAPAAGQTYDVAFTAREPIDTSILRNGALLIGLRAHLVPYAALYPQLTHQRRVGDRLWVGSGEPFDPESLFPGNALVKLGDDSVDTSGPLEIADE